MGKNACWILILGLEKEKIPFKKYRAFVGLERVRGTPDNLKIKAIGIDFDKVWAKVVLGDERIERVECEIVG